MTKAPIEEGRFYRTRDGTKAGPMRAIEDGVYRWGGPVYVPGNGMVGFDTWDEDGFWLCEDDPSNLDLIAEWSTPAARYAAE